jgi:transcriptional regulator with XRE-family HTH domain
MVKTPLIMRTRFGHTLGTLRNERDLTIYQLAEAADVPATLISALQHGNRTVGENNATKIGTALGLSGAALQDFVFLALNDAKGKVLEQYRAYPAEVLNLVAITLQAAGIAAHQISRCTLHPASANGNEGADALLYLTHGKTASINVEVTQQ